MRKSILGFMLIVIMFLGSCKKDSNNPTTNTTNNFTFKSTTYTTDSCTASADILTATSNLLVNTSSYGMLALYFYGNNLPSTGGTFSVFQYNTVPSSNTQVTMVLTTVGTNPATYYATGGNGSNESVTVSVSQTGLVTVSGNGIEMVNAANASDSSSLSLHIIQTH